MNLICFIVVSEVNNYNRLYEELHSLGSGAFGEVFVVKDKYNGNEYAVKKIKYESN
jgi:serine/threonine protein kinase